MHSKPDRGNENPQARIQSHGAEAGPPSPEAVEQRAREIAHINGRSPKEVNEEDRRQAARELHDDTLPLSTDDSRSDVSSSVNPAVIASETGHKTEDRKPVDEQQFMEEEIKEGMREAEHERMYRGQDET